MNKFFAFTLIGVLTLSLLGNLYLTRKVEELSVRIAQKKDLPRAVQSGPQKIVEPWKWAKIETTSYKEYIQNLRAVGCPEASIHDIVDNEIHRLYSNKIFKSSSEAKNPLEVGNITQNFRKEEREVLDTLWDRNAQTTATETYNSNSSTSTQAESTPRSTTEGTVSPQTVIPVAFAPTIGASSLTEDQANGVELVAKEFQDKLGSPPQWLGDPAYAARWEAARAAADERLRGILGWEAYNTHAEALLRGMTNVMR